MKWGRQLVGEIILKKITSIFTFSMQIKDLTLIFFKSRGFMHLDLKTPGIFLSENLFVILTSLVCIRRQTIRSKWKKRSVPGLSLLESFVRKDSREIRICRNWVSYTRGVWLLSWEYDLGVIFTLVLESIFSFWHQTLIPVVTMNHTRCKPIGLVLRWTADWSSKALLLSREKQTDTTDIY